MWATPPLEKGGDLPMNLLMTLLKLTTTLAQLTKEAPGIPPAAQGLARPRRKGGRQRQAKAVNQLRSGGAWDIQSQEAAGLTMAESGRQLHSCELLSVLC